jgi:hypothetical protein
MNGDSIPLFDGDVTTLTYPGGRAITHARDNDERLRPTSITTIAVSPPRQANALQEMIVFVLHVQPPQKRVLLG